MKPKFKTRNKWVKIEDIQIPYRFFNIPPNPISLLQKAFKTVKTDKHGKVVVDDSLLHISCDENLTLYDGYKSYLILKALRDMGYKDFSKVKVTVTKVINNEQTTS